MKWRLIRMGDIAPALNMAIDEAMMYVVGSGQVPPTVRLYGWSPPTLSIGRFQRIETVDREAIRVQKCGLVRRPTGGRAVWHAKEVTYAIVVPEHLSGVPTSVVDSYRLWSEGICEALRACALPAQLAPVQGRDVDSADERSAVCFDTPSSYEVVVGGRKIAGSAQVRQQGAILQHGSILLEHDVREWSHLLRVPSEQYRAKREAVTRAHATSINDELVGRGLPPVNRIKVEQALLAGWEKTLGVTWEQGELSGEEIQRAQQLVETTYAHESWTSKR